MKRGTPAVGAVAAEEEEEDGVRSVNKGRVRWGGFLLKIVSVLKSELEHNDNENTRKFFQYTPPLSQKHMQ